MKKIYFIFAIVVFTLASCEKNEVTIVPETAKVLTPEQQRMRSALETTTNIFLDMISKDQSYFDDINKVIVAGSPEYLEDRVMLKDLFSNTSKSGSLRVKANTNKFTSEFKNAFVSIKPQKIGGIDGVNSNIFSNSDSLIQFLTENNVSLYCPFPIEGYAENNRIPAITCHPMNNDTVNIGYMFKNNGSYDEVQVCQAFSNLHPVWIFMPYEDTNISQKVPKLSKASNGYEVSVSKIYCKQYYGGIFDGDLDMHIVRIDPSNCVLNTTTNSYSGGIMTDIAFALPRKYVSAAKNNYWSGWYEINLVWDTDWNSTENSSIMYIYEWDKKGSQTKKIPINTYDENGKVLANLGNLEVTTQSSDATICLSEWSRFWFMDILSNGRSDWYWQHSAGSVHYDIDGNKIFKVSNDFLMTMEARNY